MAPIVWFFGWLPVAYLFLSTAFALGVHPVGARWIQEHYVFREGQETYSYYGPLNKLSFNMGYHNEHHDFPQVPWSRLPKVRALAPEFYDHLYYHRSWTKLLFHVSATDVATYASVAALVIGTACVACLIPSRRALHADPTQVFRGG